MYPKKNSICFVIILVLVSLKVTAQDFQKNPTQIPDIPPSPTMWEFQKYGNYPVSMHTGVPNISIPLLTAQSGSLSIPISLSYHASGIKVEQKAGWVGLGWTLNAGGAITRTVRGGADEGPDGYINYPYDPSYNLNGTLEDKIKSEAILHGGIDTEPDMFNYNFMGYSGRFVFNHSENQENATIALIPHDKDVKIEPIFNQHDIVGFMFTTPEGIRAEFGYAERTGQTRSSLLALQYTSAATTWHLKRITDANGVDEITFEYELVGENGRVRDRRYSDSHTIDFSQPCFPNDHFVNLPQQTTIDANFFDVKKIKKINFKNGYLQFQPSRGNRSDDLLDEELRLDAIELHSNVSTPNSLIKAFEMEYGYLGVEADKRLKLDKVYEVGSDSNRKSPHQFFYKNKLGGDILPSRLSAAQDYWGYYNGKISNENLVPEMDIEIHRLISNTTERLGSADRNPDCNYTQAGMLNQIVYPTGGYTFFEYENNDCTVRELGSTEDLQRLAGGVRIKRISSYDADGEKQFVKSYEYRRKENPQLSSGVYNGIEYISPEDFFFSRTRYLSDEERLCPGTNGGQAILDTARQDGVSSSPTISSNFASVFYSDVKEYIGTPENNEGYTWYFFDADKDDMIQGSGPSASIAINRDWDRGQLIKQETFKKGETEAIATVVNEYEEVTYQSTVEGFRMGTYFDVPAIDYDNSLLIHTPGRYFITEFNEPIVWKRLKKTTSTQDGVSTAQEFSYDLEIDHTNVVKTTSVDSNMDVLETKMYYPDDILSEDDFEEGGSMSTDAFNQVLKLNKSDQHRTATPIQTVSSRNGELLSIVRNLYKTDTGNLVPSVIKTAKIATALEERVVYKKYNASGRPIEILRKDGVSVSYVWGYHDEHPIAKIENISYDDIPSAVINNIKTLSNSDTDRTRDYTSNEGALREALDTFRNTQQNAMITTYTYDPLIGVTSMTDPRGYTIYYEYDEFNRLKEVRDEDNNLVTDYEYHYKSQTN